jgi:truncated hemoglobin YjbI
MTYEDILKLVTEFYQLATNDFLIGYHFRVIQDFDTHVPRIASFWENQVSNHVTHPEHFPFRMMAKHFPLKIKQGELDRWVLLFFEVLDREKQKNPQHEKSLELWKEKILFIKEKFQEHPAMLQRKS